MASYASVAKADKSVKKTSQEPYPIKVSYTDEEPEIVYVTEKGCDLYKIWPDIAAIDRATRQGYSWYDLLYTEHGESHRNIRARPIKVIQTTEAALAEIRAAEKAAAAAAAVQEKERIVSHNFQKIMAIARGKSPHTRTFDVLVDVIVDVLRDVPTDLRETIGDKACEAIYAEQLIYTPEPPQEEEPQSDCDTSGSTVALEEAYCVNESAFHTPYSYATAAPSGYVTPISLDDFPCSGPVVLEGTVFLPAVTDDRRQYLLPILPLLPPSPQQRPCPQPIEVAKLPPLLPTPVVHAHPPVTTLEKARDRRCPPSEAWYLLTKKKFRQGPFTQDQMRTWYINGELSNETPVRKGLYGGFKKLRELYGVDSPAAFTY